VLKTVYRSSCRDKHNCERRDSNLGPLTPQSDALTTRLLRPANGCTSRAFGTAGIPVRKEPAGLVQEDGKRPDGCTLIRWRGGRRLAWDVTVCTTVAASYMTAASQSAGAAAEQAAERKSLKYAELSAAYEFQPVAVEKQGLRFLLSLSWGVRSRNTRATRLTDCR